MMLPQFWRWEPGRIRALAGAHGHGAFPPSLLAVGARAARAAFPLAVRNPWLSVHAFSPCGEHRAELLSQAEQLGLDGFQVWQELPENLVGIGLIWCCGPYDGLGSLADRLDPAGFLVLSLPVLPGGGNAWRDQSLLAFSSGHGGLLPPPRSLLEAAGEWRDAGLARVCDLSLRRDWPFELPPSLSDAFSALPAGNVLRSFWMDLQREEGFRECLLAPAGGSPRLAPTPLSLAGCFFHLRAERISEADGGALLELPGGRVLGLSHPQDRRICTALSEAGEIPWASLAHRLGDMGEDALGERLWRLICTEAADFSHGPRSQWAADPWLLRGGTRSAWGRELSLSRFDRSLLQGVGHGLSGDALVGHLVAAALAGDFEIGTGPGPCLEPGTLPLLVSQALPVRLRFLEQAGAVSGPG